MRLQELRVVHFPKVGAAMAAPAGVAGAFELNTCQRRLWVYPAAAEFADGTAGVAEGTDAYRLLLRVATGLESQVRGETDVFGQLKEAWAKYESSASNGGGAFAAALAPWMRRLFEDAKEVRARHLQNVGGGSYGSLLRKLLREKGVRPGDEVLLVGAGQLARAVAPYLEEQRVTVWNRTRSGADEVAALCGTNAVAADSGPDLKAARIAVVCVPVSRETDPAWVGAWLAGEGDGGPARVLIHLGALRSEAGEWTRAPNLLCLDDLFALQREGEKARNDSLKRAELACDERARLHALGGSPSLPHGWEDLAVFA